MSGDGMTCEVRIDTSPDGSFQVLVTCRPLVHGIPAAELYRIEAEIARIMADMLREVLKALRGGVREERLTLIYDHEAEEARQP